MRSTLLVMILVLTACGADPASTGDGAPKAEADDPNGTDPAKESLPADGSLHSMMITSAAALPACNAAAEGWLAYLKAEAKFQTCASGVWADVDIKGAKGDPGTAGANGDQGETGEQGADGASNRVIATVGCQGTLGATSLVGKHFITYFESGDVFAYGSIANSLDESGASRYWAANQVGAATAHVSVTKDEYNTPGSGWWSFDFDPATEDSTVQFHDIEMGGTGVVTYTLSGGQCSVNVYD